MHRRFVQSKSLITALALAMLVSLLGACSSGGGGGGSADAPAGLSSVSGTVVGYPYSGTSTVQAFAPNDDSQLVTGLLYPAPNARVEANLTAVNNIPASAFVNPFFCNNVDISPPTAMTTGVVLLGVADTGGLYAALTRATTDPTFEQVSVGTTLHYIFVASQPVSFRGTCSLSGITYQYDLDMVRGWNHVTARVDAIDSLGGPVKVLYFDQAPPANAVWYFAELAGMGLEDADDNAASVQAIVEKGLEGIGY